MTEFDPARHRMVSEQRWFEDFVLGERFVIPSRTQTSAVFAAFQTASGDTHPVHYDVEYCRVRGMPHLLAHGFQTLVHTAPKGTVNGVLRLTEQGEVINQSYGLRPIAMRTLERAFHALTMALAAHRAGRRDAAERVADACIALAARRGA